MARVMPRLSEHGPGTEAAWWLGERTACLAGVASPGTVIGLFGESVEIENVGGSRWRDVGPTVG